MGWNGSGTFNRSDGTRSGTQVWQDAKTAGVKIRADDHDTHDQDIADGLENTVALDGQTTTTTDNAILRYDSGNTKFEGVTISASQLVGRAASGDVKGINVASARALLAIGSAVPTNGKVLFWSSSSSAYDQGTSDVARAQLNLGTAAPSNNKILIYSSASSQYVQRFGFPNVNADVTATDEELNTLDGFTGATSDLNSYPSLETAVDASNGGANDLTAIDFTGLRSGAKRITIQLFGVSLSASDSILIQIGDSGGFETTGYNSASATIPDAANPAVTSNTSGIILRTVATAARGIVVLERLTSTKWSSSHSLDRSNTQIVTGGGTKELSGVLDRVRVTRTGTDTFTGGDINILVE